VYRCHRVMIGSGSTQLVSNGNRLLFPQ